MRTKRRKLQNDDPTSYPFEGYRCLSLGLGDDVRVTGVGDGEDTDTEVLSAGGTELDVGASVVVDTSLGQHGVVLNLGLAERGAVTRDDDQLGC